MPRPSSDLLLGVLTDMGQRLPSIRTPDEAAREVVRAVAPLDVAAALVAVLADTGVIMAVNSPPGVATRLSPGMAEQLVGVRVPLDAIESLREPVRLQRPYCGVAGAAGTLRRLATDSALAQALPASSDEGQAVSVPVVFRDRVVAVLAVWGRGCSETLIPTLETVATMLAGSWETDNELVVERFPAVATSPEKTAQLRSAVESLLVDERIAAAVQPIVRLYDHTVIGYEALARFSPREHVASPDQLFAAASLLHMQADVDLACMRGALSEAPNVGDADLFINVLIGTLLDQHGMEALDHAVRDAGVDPRSIVLEFSEREPVSDLARLQRIAAGLRARGFRIAVDDAGAGHASMRVIAELRPEFIKVDRSLIHAIESDRARRALVMALLSFSGHIGARLIAEGIETQAEREALISLGVQFGQGWLLGRPVLTQFIHGQSGIEVVDAAWFARRPVSPTRIVPIDTATATPAAAAAVLAAPTHTASRTGLPRALSDAATALQSEHDPMRILGVMSELMSRVVPVSEMAIFMAEYETHRLVPVIATGPDREELLADSFSMDAGLTGWAFAQGTLQNIADTSAHPLARQVPGTPVVQESLLLVPLVAGEHKLGIINCWRTGVGKFTESELEAASLFAHIAAAAWRNAQLYAELLSAVMTDPLTHLYNSRWLRDSGERDLTRAARDGRPLALLLIDLDHFKTVNDHSGHAAGDLVLQRAATRLRTTVRGADAIVRLGGEEFVALLHDCDADGAAVVAEAMRMAVRDIALPAECALPRLTASIGIASYPAHGRELDQLLAAADRAMYSAKHGGRDQVATAPLAAADGRIVPLPRRSRAAGGGREAPAGD
ncbi:MAG: EAL domain-containing protein [Candidatus Dormibacter sp.]